MKRRELAEKICPVARASAQLVDGWTFVIFREIYAGNRRFNALLQHTGMSPRSLTLRLRKLEDEQILERRESADGKRARDYALTPKGHALWPVMITLKQWGDDWCGPWPHDQPPVQTQHRDRGHALRVGVVCETCGELVDGHAVDVCHPEWRQRERDGS